MNIEQLEKLRTDIAIMRTGIEGDTTGAMQIKEAIKKLETVILRELQGLVWKRYLEAE